MLPEYCLRCEVRQSCNGECPKHRFATTPDGQPGLNYLCAGYKKFFTHIQPYMRIMADLLNSQRPPAMIMQILAEREGRARVMSAPGATAHMPHARRPGRNDPCPCGSVRKYKKCCGNRA